MGRPWGIGPTSLLPLALRHGLPVAVTPKIVVFRQPYCDSRTMQITVTIPDELAAQVQARGFALETYVRDLVEEKLSQKRGRTTEGGRRDAPVCSEHGFTTDVQDLKSMVHEGHKY
jgi:hypothetical protein